jgi:hypothetical protein
VKGAIVAGVIRNGRLTHPELRHDQPIDEYESQRAVLIVLPVTGSNRITAATLEEAKEELEAAIAQLDPA